MDPNETLAQIRTTRLDAITAMDGDSGDAEHDTLFDLVRFIGALDGWLSRGGFLPSDWAANR